MNLQEIVNEAERLGSYFATVTTRNKDKNENDLNHYVFRKNFEIADVIPSLDNCVNQLGVKPEKTVEVIVPPKVEEERKPLRIAIMSHFSSMPQYYSPARACRNQIKLLKNHGHLVVMFVQEKSKLTEADLGCEVRHVVPSFRREKMVVNEEAKNKFIQVLREHLTDKFDVGISHDFFLQDTKTYSEAIRECQVPIQWFHFARSGIAHDMTFAMPNAHFIYLNKSDIGQFAKSIKVSPEQCRTVYNEKEIEYLFNFHPLTMLIINRFKLWFKDVIMTYPLCSTRCQAKGIRDIIRIFAELKKLGNKVSLIVPNANGRKRVDDLKKEEEFAESCGLSVKDGDFIFTSFLDKQMENELPNIVCAQLMQVSNIFVAASRAEVGPNTILEASMAKNLIVINDDLACFKDFINQNVVLKYPMTSNHSLHYSGRTDRNYRELAKQIVVRLREDWTDRQFRFVWRQHNAEAIYKMLEAVLYESFDK